MRNLDSSTCTAQTNVGMSHDVTGGMAAKLKACTTIAKEYGIPVYVVKVGISVLSQCTCRVGPVEPEFNACRLILRMQRPRSMEVPSE